MPVLLIFRNCGELAHGLLYIKMKVQRRKDSKVMKKNLFARIFVAVLLLLSLSLQGCIVLHDGGHGRGGHYSGHRR